jgi:hypothetical protein
MNICKVGTINFNSETINQINMLKEGKLNINS